MLPKLTLLANHFQGIKLRVQTYTPNGANKTAEISAFCNLDCSKTGDVDLGQKSKAPIASVKQA